MPLLQHYPSRVIQRGGAVLLARFRWAFARSHDQVASSTTLLAIDSRCSRAAREMSSECSVMYLE